MTRILGRDEDLRTLIHRGVSKGEAADALGLTYNGLYTWCLENDHLGLWRQLADSPNGGYFSEKAFRRRRST